MNDLQKYVTCSGVLHYKNLTYINTFSHYPLAIYIYIYICQTPFLGDFTCFNRLLEEVSKHWTLFGSKLF